jgi:RecA/RadA recombinase
MADTKWYSKIQKMHQGMIADSLPSTKAKLLPLPSPSLNWALGGGLVFGKIATIYGPEASGKSLLAQLAIAELHFLLTKITPLSLELM